MSKFDTFLHINGGKDAFEVLDLDKTWFSVQDVMELTLLHAQQLQLMQVSFE